MIKRWLKAGIVELLVKGKYKFLLINEFDQSDEEGYFGDI